MCEPLDSLTFRPVDATTWGDLVGLFEARGGPKHCWCMVWRPMPRAEREAGGAARKAALRRSVDDGVPVGVLAYLDGEPVGWCSVAPRNTYRNLGGQGDMADPSIWSIVCFYVPRRFRNKGMTVRLIEAAVEYARELGAQTLEAYPVDPDSPSYRFMGFVSTFRKAGFEEVGTAGSRRHVMRLAL